MPYLPPASWVGTQGKGALIQLSRKGAPSAPPGDPRLYAVSSTLNAIGCAVPKPSTASLSLLCPQPPTLQPTSVPQRQTCGPPGPQEVRTTSTKDCVLLGQGQKKSVKGIQDHLGDVTRPGFLDQTQGGYVWVVPGDVPLPPTVDWGLDGPYALSIHTLGILQGFRPLYTQ